METKIDKLVQEKQARKEVVPITAISIGAIAATSSISVPTSASSTVATSAKSTTHPTDEANKLIQAMEDMSIETKHINKLKEKVKILEDEMKLAEVMQQAEKQKANRLNDKIHQLEKNCN